MYDRASLAKLPVELLDIVAVNIGDLLDLACFAMTSIRNYMALRRYLVRRILEIYRPVSWAGERVICLGTRVSREDLPSGFLTDAEDDELDEEEEIFNEYDFEEAASLTPEEALALDYPCAPCDPDSLRMVERLERIRCGNFAHDFRAFWGSLSWRYPGSSTADEIAMLKSLLQVDGPNYDDIYKPISDPYILRNIVKKEYIRGDSFAGVDCSGGFSDNPQKLCFQLALMVMTMCSRPKAINSWREPTPPDPVFSHRGSWAGQRFDIVVLSRVHTTEEDSSDSGRADDGNEGKNNSAWTDISENFKEMIEELLRRRGNVMYLGEECALGTSR
ncbi:hypothetical protein DXG01_001664 [Tephrocybe rancida]|nr:hypothetical protein DXG01_001664 [Tephrocybe rancida]